MKKPLDDRIKKRIAWTVLFAAIIAMIYLSIISGSTFKDETKRQTKTSIVVGKKDSRKSKIQVLIDGLSLRSSAGVEYGNKISDIGKDTVLVLLGKKGDWYKVKTPQGQTGYVSAKPEYTKRVN